jgi:hypothetical protein
MTNHQDGFQEERISIREKIALESPAHSASTPVHRCSCFLLLPLLGCCQKTNNATIFTILIIITTT